MATTYRQRLALLWLLASHGPLNMPDILAHLEISEAQLYQTIRDVRPAGHRIRLAAGHHQLMPFHPGQ